MWQKCPVCDGQGAFPKLINSGTKLCHVCNGHGIISILTGTPPSHEKLTWTRLSNSSSGSPTIE